MSSYQDLVAGDWDAGLINGFFYSSRFNIPCGMAINPEGTRLYVADSGNHCIRVVDLEHANQVSTLTGTGKAGYSDGTLSNAVFNQPNQLAFLPDQQIAVNDEGNFCIRLIDLKSKTVSTLVGNGKAGVNDGEGKNAQVGQIENMAYFPNQNKLFFTQPESGALRVLDLKTLQVTTLIRNKPEIPQPSALCVSDGKLYVVGDQTGQQVYEGVPVTAAGQGATFNWAPFAKGNEIESLAWSGNILYAVQKGPTAPLARLTPAYQPVTFVSIWGKTMPNQVMDAFFDDAQLDNRIALVADPQSEHKFYISHPHLNIVTSYRDLFIDRLQNTGSKNSGGLFDYEYPLKKPPRTFRILLYGESNTAYNIHDEPNPPPEGSASNRSAIMSKRLEATLNMTASLLDVPTRFEILQYWRNGGEHMNIWSYYEIPELAQKYDVDMVLGVYSPNFDVDVYFERPLTQEGIPSHVFNPEFMLKPVQERIRNGTPKKFLDICLAKKIATITPDNKIQWAFQFMPADPELLDCAAQMLSEPISLLRKKLNGMRTSQGKPIRFEETLLPGAGTANPHTDPAFSREVFEKAQTDYIDLSQEMTAYRVSFYPFSEIGGSDHFTADGHFLVSSWLAFELIRQKVVPFEPQKNDQVPSFK